MISQSQNGSAWWCKAARWVSGYWEKLRRGGLRRGAVTRSARGRTTRQIGAFGEAQAARFLQAAGLRVVCRNWRHKRDEIDIVAKEGEVLVFVEVRLRRAQALTPGFHTVGAKKKTRLGRVCRAYLRQLSPPPRHFRFDVVEVRLYEDGKVDLNHYPNVALFPKHFVPRGIHYDQRR